MPEATPFDKTMPYAKIAAPWVKQYDFRFIEGEPGFAAAAKDAPHSAHSKLWIGDRVPRRIDMLSLVSMSDAFFARVFHARRELVPFGTVTLTTYFQTSVEDLAAEDITHVLACADARAFNRSYHDQTGELWSPSGKLIATTTQMGYFKA